MPWFRVDDGFYSSRKVTQIPRAERWGAIGLWTIAGTWSAKELTDGFIPDYQLEELGGRESDADNLVRTGLWLRVEGGFEFSNWGEYQPTKAETEAAREKEAERKRKWRESRQESRGTDTGQDAGHQQASGHPDPTRPDPARPDPSKDLARESMFDAAYDFWPKKVDRKDAAVRWPRAVKEFGGSESELVEIVKIHAEAYAAHKSKQFTPSLLVWLNKNRWDNELPTADVQERQPAVVRNLSVVEQFRQMEISA